MAALGTHARSGSNGLRPDLMSTRERITALCEILAAGLLRLRLREAEEDARERTFGLHFPPDRSGHATPTHEETA